MTLAIILTIVGVAMLYGGAEALIRGSVGLAQHFGVPPLIIGITVVAFGTSVPEVVTSLMAHLGAGSTDIALGNIIGSNIANIALVLGLAALLFPITVSSDVRYREMPIMVGVTAFFLCLFAVGIHSAWGRSRDVTRDFLLHCAAAGAGKETSSGSQCNKAL